MSKVTAVRVNTGRKDRGVFCCENFNLFEPVAALAYSELMTQANDASSGITIEHIREYTKKSTTTQGVGEDQVVTTTEDIILVVQYWKKKPKRGGSRADAKREQYALKVASIG